jgi:hypothetical protein
MLIIKGKRKSILINGDVHQLAKDYCDKNFLKLTGFIENLILKELKKTGNGNK